MRRSGAVLGLVLAGFATGVGSPLCAELLGGGESPSFEAVEKNQKYPTALPTGLPDQAFGAEGGRVLWSAEDQGFDVSVDTPAFGNNGRCYGMVMTIAAWFEQFIRPAAGANPVPADEQVPFAWPAAELGDPPRLRHATCDDAGTLRVARAVQLLMQDQHRAPSPVAAGFDHRQVNGTLQRELARPGGGLAPLLFRTPVRGALWWKKGGAEHALLVYRCAQAVAAGDKGTRVPVFKYSFYDPNFPPASSREPDERGQHLIYYPQAERLGFARGTWLDTYNQAPAWRPQVEGETYLSSLLGTVALHDAAPRRSRRQWYAAQDGRANAEDDAWYRREYKFDAWGIAPPVEAPAAAAAGPGVPAPAAGLPEAPGGEALDAGVDSELAAEVGSEAASE